MFKTHLNSIITALVLVIAGLTATENWAKNIDPTRPFGQASSGGSAYVQTEGGFILTSIIHGDGIHTAVINGKIYQMFDYIGEYRITAINSHSVILRSEAKRLKIFVFNTKGFKSNVVEDMVAN